MIAYSMGSYDILRESDLRDIDRQTQLSKSKKLENFAIGVYSDELCQALGFNKPIKDLKDRMNIMKYIRGVDFVFPVYSLDQNLIKESMKKAKIEHEESKEKETSEKKKYQLSYAPGTYDLFHAGHLENLLLASKDSEKLIVGVKSDELVQKHKNKSPIISAEERMEILRHFKFVYDVYTYYTRDLQIANDYIKSKYNKAIDAVFLGSDLKNDFKDEQGINIVYTTRDPKMMEERSTTAYSKKYKSLSLGKDNYGEFKGKIDCHPVSKGAYDTDEYNTEEVPNLDEK